jgi:hypothetical protein
LQARQAELLPVDYYHLGFTLPAAISAIAYYNEAVLYDLLFALAAETLRTIAAAGLASSPSRRGSMSPPIHRPGVAIGRDASRQIPIAA